MGIEALPPEIEGEAPRWCNNNLQLIGGFHPGICPFIASYFGITILCG